MNEPVVGSTLISHTSIYLNGRAEVLYGDVLRVVAAPSPYSSSSTSQFTCIVVRGPRAGNIVFLAKGQFRVASPIERLVIECDD